MQFMNEPEEITAGFEYTWTESLSDYKADDGWTLYYKGLNASGKIEMTAAADGSDHTVTILAATSADYAAGIYQVYKYVIKDDEKILISTFNLKVSENPLSVESLDTRTQERKMLEALEALELGRADRVQKSFQIAGRAIEYLTPDEIIKWKNYYSRIVNAQEGKTVVKRRFSNFTSPT